MLLLNNKVDSSQDNSTYVGESSCTSPTNSVTLPLTPTNSQSTGLGPFTDVAGLRQFIMEHPMSCFSAGYH